VKYKCYKAKCPVCGNTRSLQLFINNTGRITYSRVRHYQGKGKYTYCKIEKTQLETLKCQSIQLPSVLDQDQTGQEVRFELHDPQLRSSSSIHQNKWAGSSARIEHHPPKASKNNDPQINWEKYGEFLLSKFSRSYALQVLNNGLRHFDCLENPNNISAVPVTTRSNVLKAMVNLSKYLGTYETYKTKLRNNGVKWANTDDSFNSFLRIVNNNHNSLHQWYKAVNGVLRDNERLFLKYTLVTGLRKGEAVNSFNLIIELAREGRLLEYYNEELGILEHFRYADLFLRATKKVYISIVSKELIDKICNSQPVSYSAIRKRLNKHNQKLRFKELRSYFATYLRKHGILAEYIDLLQGRIPKSVFAKHYLKIESVQELVQKVNAVTEIMESSLLS
jgi:hypothetical protein